MAEALQYERRMRRFPVLLAFAAAILLPTCRTVPDEVALPAVCDAISSGRTVVGSSRDTATAVFGAPAEVTTQEQPNRHVPDAMDRIHTLEFDAARVVIHEATPVDRELLTSITVRSRNAPVTLAAYVGRTREQLLAGLGPPDREQGTHASWECNSEVPETLTIVFEGDRSVAARAEYYVD